MDETLSENAQNVKQQLEALIKLQQLDDEINQRNKQIDQLKQQIEDEDKTINSLREILTSRKQEMEKLLKDRREAEVTAKQKSEEIQKLGGQLFEVKTNEAYSALQHEIQQKKQENSLLEERILEMMMAEDELKVKIKQAEDELKEGEQQVTANQAGYNKEIARLQKEIADYQQQWDIASQNVRADYLDRYKRLRSAKGGQAMAKIENDICMGCRLSIRPQATIELKKYRGLLYCDNCARILYVD